MQNSTYCLCVSGFLGYTILQNLCIKGMNIVSVLTDSRSETIIDYCKQQNICCFKGNPRHFKASQWLDKNRKTFQYLLSVNYLFILEEDILKRAEVAVNFHGSLLPKYRGRTPHVWAIINGERECGITAHLMNSLCDDGDILKQIHIKIEDEDTGAMILAKYNNTYPILVEDIVSMIESNNIQTTKQDITKATYYGKRTPDDGVISWEWQKERIRNWVRAQAKPYPGAFSHINDKKITIHRISYSDYGYRDTTPNGSVLKIIDGKPIIKTPNGAIVLEDYEYEDAIEEGQTLTTK